MYVPLRQFLNLTIYVANPDGTTDQAGEINREEPVEVKAAWAQSVQKHRYHQADEVGNQSELITLKEVEQRARIWPPNTSLDDEEAWVEPDHTHEVNNPFTGAVEYYVTRI